MTIPTIHNLKSLFDGDNLNGLCAGGFDLAIEASGNTCTVHLLSSPERIAVTGSAPAGMERSGISGLEKSVGGSFDVKIPQGVPIANWRWVAGTEKSSEHRGKSTKNR